MNYVYNPSDSIITFINTDFSEESAKQLLKEVGYNSISCILGPCSASHAVLVDKTTNYSFTSVEIEWLHAVNTVIAYNVNESYTVMIVDMNCNIEDYYIYCAAIVKIIEKAFNLNALYVFKISNSIAFGCLRDFSRNIPNNYIISETFNEEDVDDFSELLDEVFIEDIDNLPFLISEYSPLKSYESENDNYYNCYSDRLYDKNEYINTLLEIQSIYGVDTSRERERSTFILEKRTHAVPIDCSELTSVADDSNQISSYEELVIATAESQKAINNIYDNDIQLSLYDEELPNVSDDAYEDAEQMLKELLGK